ncbi:MAG: hypothetical protein PSX71_14085 [bacterium]|nr:hypothetical protein [bacterium]
MSLAHLLISPFLIPVELLGGLGGGFDILDWDMAATLNGAPYPLNDDGTLAAGVGMGHLATMAPDYSSFAYVYTGAGEPSNTAAAFSTAAPFTADGTRRTARLTVDQFPAGAADMPGVNLYVFWIHEGALAGQQVAGIARSAGNVYSGAPLTALPDVPLPADPTGKYLELYVTEAGAIGWNVDGVDQGLTGSTVTAGDTYGFYVGVNANGAFDPVGETIAATFSMTAPVQSLPAGAAKNSIYKVTNLSAAPVYDGYTFALKDLAIVISDALEVVRIAK